MTHSHTTTPDHAPDDPGALIRWPRRYDLLVGLVMAGRGSRVRSQIADALALGPGQRVLDVGCGTGSLTLTLAKRVGTRGTAAGVKNRNASKWVHRRSCASTTASVPSCPSRRGAGCR